ncbi:MAG: hypothetical protein AAGC74_07340 [Verrucomicrobiota bacterium]
MTAINLLPSQIDTRRLDKVKAERIYKAKYKPEQVSDGGGSHRYDNRDSSHKTLTSFPGSPRQFQCSFSTKGAELEAKLDELVARGKQDDPEEARLHAILQLHNFQVAEVVTDQQFETLGHNLQNYINENWYQTWQNNQTTIGAQILLLILIHNLHAKRTNQNHLILNGCLLPSAALPSEQKLLILPHELNSEARVEILNISSISPDYLKSKYDPQ